MSFPSPSQFFNNIGTTLSNLRLRPEVGQALNSLGDFLNPKNHESGILSPIKVNPPKPTAIAIPTPSTSVAPPAGTGNTVILDHSNAPLVNLPTSNIAPQVSSIGGQISDIQKQLDATTKINDQAQKSTATNQNAPTTDQPAQPNFYDKILGLFKTGQDQINNLPKVQSLDEATNSVLSKFGYTPESFKQVADLNNQLTAVNTQINDLETQRKTEVANLGGNGGSTVGTAGAEEGRINRAYAVRESGLGAKASVLTATINTLRGAYSDAESAAKDYVAFATTQQRQLVSDIQYSMNFYKDVYSAMDSSDTKKLQQALDYAINTQKIAETKAQNDINNELKKQGLDIQQMLASAKLSNAGGSGDLNKLLTVDEAQKLGVPYGTTKGEAAAQHPLASLPETKAKDLTNAVKLANDAQTMKDMIDNGFQVWRMKNPFDTDGRKFAAAYNAILHTYASEISTQLLRTSSNQETIKSLLPGIFSSKNANSSNLQQLIDRANGLTKSIDPSGVYKAQVLDQMGGSGTSQVQGGKQVMYQGKKYNVDASGNMTLAQ